MRFEEALFLYLKNHTGIKNIVSDRVYPLVIPQESITPALTYQRVSVVRYHNLQGDCGDTAPTYQIAARADSYLQVKQLAEQVRFALQNFTGVMGGEQGVYIGAVLMESETEGYEQATQTYYIDMDFKFIYTEETE